MITLRCCICDLELGQAGMKVRITCPSCQRFREHVREFVLKGTSKLAPFRAHTWFHEVYRVEAHTKDIILEITRIEPPDLDNLLNDDATWSSQCPWKEFARS